MQTADRKQQGIKSILTERNLWANGLKLDCKPCNENNPKVDNLQCCARRILSECPDFKIDKCWLEETVESLGCSLIFLPKFHCELNFIEMLWGSVKAQLRRQCTFSFKELGERLPFQLDNIPVALVKKVNRHCIRYMDVYRAGLIGPELDYAVKRFRGHKMIPRKSLELIKSQLKKKALMYIRLLLLLSYRSNSSNSIKQCIT